MATSDAPPDSEPSRFYTPTDPALRRSPALPYLEWCIMRVAWQATEAGSPRDLVWDSLSQRQTQFDAVLSTLDGAFHLLGTDLTPAMNKKYFAAAFLDIAWLQAPQSQAYLFRDPRKDSSADNNHASGAAPNGNPHQRTGLSRSQFEAAVLELADHSQVADYIRRHKEAEAARQHHVDTDLREPQRAPVDEDWRAANSRVVGNWLEGIPQAPDNIARQLTQSDHDSQDDPILRDTQPDDYDKRSAFDDSIRPPSIGHVTSDPLPAFTRPDIDINPHDEFESWAEQKRDEFRRNLNLKAYDGSPPTSQ